MIGHRQIVEARRSGLRPAAIFFDMGAPPVAPSVDGQNVCAARRALRAALYDPEHALESGQFPTVYLAATDKAPDLRFVVGMTCFVNAPKWSQALLNFAHHLATFSPLVVVATAIAETTELLLFRDGEWSAA